VWFVPKKVGEGGRICEYMHARAIHNVLTQSWTVQKGWSNPPNKSHPVTKNVMNDLWVVQGFEVGVEVKPWLQR